MVISLNSVLSKVPELGDRSISTMSTSLVSFSKGIIVDEFNTLSMDGIPLRFKDIKYYDMSSIMVNGKRVSYDDLDLHSIIVFDTIPTLIVKECINAYMLSRTKIIQPTEMVDYAYVTIFDAIATRPLSYGLNEDRYNSILQTLDVYLIAKVINEISRMLNPTMLESYNNASTFNLSIHNFSSTDRYFIINSEVV